MIKSVEATGKTIEEAIEKAYEMLGVNRDEADVSIEIIDRPKSGFLGLGSVPAKVRASYDDGIEEPKPAPKAEKPAEKKQPKPEKKLEAEVTVNAEPTPIGVIGGEDGATAVFETEQPKRERKHREHREPKPQAEAEHTEHVEKIPDVTLEEVETRKNRAVEFLAGMLERMGAEATVVAEVREENKSIAIRLDGENVGMLIGRRGETLSAIQHITGYMANKGESERVRVIVDVEGYRSKREEALRGLANRTAMKAVRLRHNITLEPMNAYERHIIHTALQEWRDVSTFSTGAEPRRAVVVAYTPGGGKGEKRERSGDRRDRRDRRDRPRREQTSEAQPRPKSQPLPEQVWE